MWGVLRLRPTRESGAPLRLAYSCWITPIFTPAFSKCNFLNFPPLCLEKGLNPFFVFLSCLLCSGKKSNSLSNLFLFSHCHSPFPLNYFPLMLPLPLLCASHTPGSPPAASCLPTTTLHFTWNLGCLLWQGVQHPGDLCCERLTVCSVLWLTHTTFKRRLKDAVCNIFLKQTKHLHLSSLHAGKRRLETPHGEPKTVKGRFPSVYGGCET